MNNKQFYKEAFDSIRMSPESIRKVKNMSEINKKRKLKTGFRVAIAAAALAAIRSPRGRCPMAWEMLSTAGASASVTSGFSDIAGKHP